MTPSVKLVRLVGGYVERAAAMSVPFAMALRARLRQAIVFDQPTRETITMVNNR